MTEVVYKGTADFRTIHRDNLPSPEMGWREGEDEYIWSPGDRHDVPENVAKYLTEFHPQEFVLFEDPKGRDHRTVEELKAEATELDISGRSKMNREELLDAIYARRAEIEADKPEPEAQDPTEGGPPFEAQSVNESIGDPHGVPGTVKEV